ncbi:hypothetical protein [Pedobacter nutrimenti]|uniref:hypothetical protein n=1 Tax=Pedobacter nutrimenti TaxID=1241337 RepID=UPI002930BEA5|nr:hypothetical protein [Pedobacter nutrimenti]
MKLRTFKKIKKRIIAKNEVHLRAIASVGLIPEEIMGELAQHYCEMSKDKFQKLFKEESSKKMVRRSVNF